MAIYDSFEFLRPSQFEFQEDERVKVFAFTDQGRFRDSMEDGCAVATGLSCSASLIGVLDGHGGQDAARFCTRNLFRVLLKEQGFQDGDLKRALHNAFMRVDEMFSEEKSGGVTSSGATAAVAVVKGGRFVVAHAGDCFCSVFKSGGMVHLTQDHQPRNLEEAERIRRCGGNCRIQDGSLEKCGMTLAVTRAIGDFEFKDNCGKSREEQAVIAAPEIVEEGIEGCEYLVVASDGLSREDVESCGVEISKALSSRNQKEVRCCLQKIVSNAKSKDNKTLVLVQFKTKMKRKVEDQIEENSHYTRRRRRRR